MKVALLFGSFHPIHEGHLAILRYLAEHRLADELRLVVSPQSPFKQGRGLLDNARERLLRAGAAAFLARGFPKARLLDIVRAAGVTTGPLYWHFRDKEGLFGALVADAYDAAIALQDKFLAYYRALDDANKWREAIYGGRSFVGDLAVLLFDRLRLWNLPVTENGKYLGFVSKVGVYDNYRRMLREKHDLF